MSIEKNIERIAIALEQLVEAVTESDTPLVDASALLPSGGEEKKEVAVAQKKKRASRKKVVDPAATKLAETEPAETEPAETEPAETEPAETPKNSEYDQEALKLLGKEVYKKKGAEAVYKVLRDNGASTAKVFELKPEVYNTVGRALESILAGK